MRTTKLGQLAVSAQGQGRGAGIETAPGGAPMGIPKLARTTVEDVVPLGEAEVSPGDHVHALHGEIGEVQGFLVDPDDHKVTHVLLKEGHLRGRKEVAIPVSAVAGITEGIRLNLTKKQVEELPRSAETGLAPGARATLGRGTREFL